jgi:F0F1-type ATP synthase membrane subunit b/b'
MLFLEVFKKLVPYLKYLVFGGAIVFLLFLWHSKSNQLSQLQQALDLYHRQMSGQLTDAEKKLESANNALGVAQSKMMEQSTLASAYKKENIQTSAEFEQFKKQYKLQLESYQRTIAQLQEQINSKNSTVITTNNPRTATDPPPDEQFDHAIDPKKEKLSYDWKSGDGRFELYDSDIFVANTTKTFTLSQHFRVTGEIYEERIGFLRTQRLTLEEVVVDGKNSDGSVRYKVVGMAKVVDSKFNYTVASPDTWVPHKGIIGLWGVISGNLGFNNGLNPRFLLGTGLEVLQWKGIGLGAQLYFDTSVWKDSGFGIDLAYRPTIKNTRLNIALDVGLATQFRQAFQSYIPMVGIKLYLW